LLPQRSKHPREMVITPKASTSKSARVQRVELSYIYIHISTYIHTYIYIHAHTHPYLQTEGSAAIKSNPLGCEETTRAHVKYISILVYIYIQIDRWMDVWIYIYMYIYISVPADGGVG